MNELLPQKRAALKRLLATGASLRAIAQVVGCSSNTVLRYKRMWKVSAQCGCGEAAVNTGDGHDRDIDGDCWNGCSACDPHSQGRWESDLRAAGWREVRPNVWERPDGALFRGPYGAWCALHIDE